MPTTTGEIQLRRGTASTWTSNNPVLAAGELGFELDNAGTGKPLKFKIGDGSTAWTSLPYNVPTLAQIAAAQPFVVDLPENHGAVRNGKIISDGTMSLSSAILTSASNPFTLADVGKAIVIGRAGLNANNNILVTTITGFNNAGSVTVGTAAAVAITNQPVWWGTDDTAAIIATISAVVTAGQANGSNYGEVWLTPGNYCVFGALIQNGTQSFGGTTKGNAQIPLPNISTTSPKFTLRIIGVGGAAPVWDQSRILDSGVNLLSNMLGGFDGTFGTSALMGGPTTQQLGTGASSNLLIILDGFTFITPWNWMSAALDLQNVGLVKVGELGFNGGVNPVNSFVLPGGSAGSGGMALRTGVFWNESQNLFERLSIMGYYYGIIPGGNTEVLDAYIVYGKYGVVPEASGRGIHFNHLITDGIQQHVSSNLLSAGPVRLDIDQWDTELSGVTTYHLDDSPGYLYGEAKIHTLGETTPLVNGAAHYTLKNPSQAGGHVASPTVPATTVALQNPFWRDAAVTVIGGTVTVIAVDGTATGLTSGTVIVPSGKTITLTYSAAPTWNWVLL